VPNSCDGGAKPALSLRVCWIVDQQRQLDAAVAELHARASIGIDFGAQVNFFELWFGPRHGNLLFWLDKFFQGSSPYTARCLWVVKYTFPFAIVGKVNFPAAPGSSRLKFSSLLYNS
jgi:hypothetical protein